MLVLGRYGLTHGVELRINWPGRIGVAPLMAAFFFAMAGLHMARRGDAVRRPGAGAGRDRAVRARRDWRSCGNRRGADRSNRSLKLYFTVKSEKSSVAVCA